MKQRNSQGLKRKNNQELKKKGNLEPKQKDNQELKRKYQLLIHFVVKREMTVAMTLTRSLLKLQDKKVNIITNEGNASLHTDTIC